MNSLNWRGESGTSRTAILSPELERGIVSSGPVHLVEPRGIQVAARPAPALRGSLEVVVSDDAFSSMLEQARSYRARVDALPDGAEISGAVKAEVKYLPHPPEPPARHGELIAQILELLKSDRLSPPQAAALERVFFGDAYADPT